MFDFSLITIDDKQYTLKFPLSAMLKAERMVGRPLQDIFTPKNKDNIPEFKLAELVILFRIGIQAEHPSIKETQADELLMLYLQSGESILQQEMLLYVLLGKALGFFRVAVDSEGKSTKALEPKEDR